MKIIFLFLIFLSIQPVLAQNGFYTIDALIVGIEDGTPFYLRRNNDKGSTDTISRGIIQNGIIHLTGHVTEPELYFLFIKGNRTYLPLMMENEIYRVRGNYSNWPHLQVDGPKQNTEYHEIWRILDNDLTELRMLKDSILKYTKLTNGTTVINQITSHRESVFKRLYYVTVPELIKKHPNSLFTPLMIKLYSKATINEKLKMYHELSVPVQRSKYGLDLIEDIELKKNIARSQKDNKAPDFILPMKVKGVELSLMDFVAKYKLVYVDFWASWCVPCRTQFEDLKNIYGKFKNQGFNILGVSIDTDERAWKKAVEEDKLQWDNVCDVKGNNSDVAKLYNLKYIPRSILVNSKGGIIAQNIHGKELDNAIEAYLNSEKNMK